MMRRSRNQGPRAGHVCRPPHRDSTAWNASGFRGRGLDRASSATAARLRAAGRPPSIRPLADRFVAPRATLSTSVFRRSAVHIVGVTIRHETTSQSSATIGVAWDSRLIGMLPGRRPSGGRGGWVSALSSTAASPAQAGPGGQMRGRKQGEVVDDAGSWGPASRRCATVPKERLQKTSRYRAEIKINDKGNSGRMYFRTTRKPSSTATRGCCPDRQHAQLTRSAPDSLYGLCRLFTGIYS